MKIMKSLEDWLNAREERKRKNNPEYAKMREFEEEFEKQEKELNKFCKSPQWTPEELRLMENSKTYVGTYGFTTIYKTDEIKIDNRYEKGINKMATDRREEIRKRMLDELDVRTSVHNVKAVDAAMKALEDLGLLVPEKPPEATALDLASTTMTEINSPEIGIFKRGYLTEYGWGCIVSRLKDNGFVIVKPDPKFMTIAEKFAGEDYVTVSIYNTQSMMNVIQNFYKLLKGDK